jgi:peptidoglycan/xylan/chitin deacetylase (PgdA/CDA1 family)
VTGKLILLYHRVGPPVLRSPQRWQYVPVWLLRAHVRALLGSGMIPRPLPELMDPRCRDGFAVTFDDGYRDNLTRGLPALRPLDVPATVFVVTGAVGGHNHWDERLGDVRERIMSSDELALLERGGWTVGSHTHTHARLPALDDRALSDELSRSRDLIAELPGGMPDFLAYPFGETDARVRSAAHAAGYRSGFLAAPSGWGGDPMAVPRVNMRSTTLGPVFTRKIRAGLVAR